MNLLIAYVKYPRDCQFLTYDTNGFYVSEL